jgi:hypothetical protein
LNAAISFPRVTPILRHGIGALFGACADTEGLKLRHVMGAVKDLILDPGLRRRTLDKLFVLRPDFENRARYSWANKMLSPAVAEDVGAARNRALRWFDRWSKKGGRGITWMDTTDQCIKFLAAGKQLKEEEGLTGEDLDRAAADMAAGLLYRTGNAMHPAYETPVGRAAKGSTAVAAVTPFTQGRLAQFNNAVRAWLQYQRDGNWKALSRRLVILAIGIPTGMALVGTAMALLMGRKERPGGFPADVLEHAAGNVYGGGEIVRLLRGGGYGSVISSPPLEAIQRTGEGIRGLTTGIEKSDRRRALLGAAGLMRGLATMAGAPADATWQLGRAITAGGGKAAKTTRGGPASQRATPRQATQTPGTAGGHRQQTPQKRQTFRDWWKAKKAAKPAARPRAVSKFMMRLRKRNPGAPGHRRKSRGPLSLPPLPRKLAKERGMAPAELAERLKRLTDRWRGRAAP